MALLVNSIQTMQRDHGVHNERACNLLAGDGRFPDWVVTTAFYSALHYVQARLFPFTDEDGTRYSSIDEFIYVHPEHSNKHQATVDLIYMEMSEIGSKYAWLRQQSHTARYIKYKTPKEDAATAIKYLGAIKVFCHPDLPIIHASDIRESQPEILQPSSTKKKV